MSSNELPTYIDPVKICRQAPASGVTMEGKILLGDLNNLTEELSAQRSHPISVKLTFSVDAEGFCCIEGALDVDLTMNCQRCLKPMTESVHSSFRVSPVNSDEEAKHLPERYEPLMMTNQEVQIAEWIAEELYLALPLVARHEPPCVSYDDDTAPEMEPDTKPVSPFAVLKNKKS